jgi:hypothetical protein
LNLEGRIINTQNFKWFSTLNLSLNSNIVKKSYSKDYSVANVLGQTFNAEGFPARSLFALKWKGLDEEGNSLIYDEYGNVQKTVRPEYVGDVDWKANSMKLYKNMGTVIPAHTIGLTNIFWYENFELSFLFMYSGGNVMISDKLTFVAPGSHEYPVSPNHWKKEGDEENTNLPNFSGGIRNTDNMYNRTYSDINFENASFLKLRQLMLTYDLAKKLGDKSPFSVFKLKFQARNIWSWCANDKGIDPEAYLKTRGMRTIPIQPTYSLGVDVKF